MDGALARTSPSGWSRRINRIVRWTDIEDRGGHFAALEEPDLLVADLREFVDSLELR